MADRATRTSSRRTTPQPAVEAGRSTASRNRPRRATRATRSQSHDISDSEDARKGVKSRRDAGSVATDSADTSAVQRTAQGGSKKAATSSRVLQDLTTVIEDASIAYPNLGSGGEESVAKSDEAPEIFDQLNAQPSKSPGGASAYSGTTARTSLSVRELADVNSEVMLDALPDLADASSRILNFIIPKGISENAVIGIFTQIQVKDSRENKKLIRLGSTLQVQRDVYGSDSFINIRRTLRALLGSQQMSAQNRIQWRPIVLLQKANLAVLQSNILTHSSPEQKDQLIEELEQGFPSCFTEGFVQSEVPPPGSTFLGVETFQLALETRTQYAIQSLGRYVGHRNFDSDEVLHQIFYKDGQNLRGWTTAGLRSEDLNNEVLEAVVQRLEAIRYAFSNPSEDLVASVQSLTKAFPWAAFAQQISHWVFQRLGELETQIELYGGAEEILESLFSDVQRRRSLPSRADGEVHREISPELELNYDPPSERSNAKSNQDKTSNLSTRAKKLSVAHFSKSSPKSISAVKNLKGRLATPKAKGSSILDPVHSEQAQPAAEVQVASTAVPPVVLAGAQNDKPIIPASMPAQPMGEPQEQPQEHDDWQPQVDDEELVLRSEERSEIRPYESEVFALKARYDAESNKENVAEGPPGPSQTSPGPKRLIDRQPGAHKVPFDSQESETAQESQENNEFIEIGENEDFERMGTPINTAQKRAKKPATKRSAAVSTTSQASPPKRVRMQEPEASRSQTVRGNRSISREAPSQSQSSAQTRDEDPPTPSQMDEYRAANTAAKEKKAYQVKPPQTRRPWSEEETERLQELIIQHGISWRLLKDEDAATAGGPILVERDQVALKDKARNMKMDYLKSTRYLPENFHLIPINKLMKQRLRSEGVTYDDETGKREDAYPSDSD